MRTWTIYICPDCGQPGTKFLSEHSIPLSCDPHGEHSHEHGGFPPERVVVVEASDRCGDAVVAQRDRATELLAEALEALDVASHLRDKRMPDCACADYDPAHTARAIRQRAQEAGLELP